MRANGVTRSLRPVGPNDGTHALVDGAPRARWCRSCGHTGCAATCRHGSTSHRADADRGGVQARLLRRYRRVPPERRSGARAEVVRRTVDFARRHELLLHAHRTTRRSRSSSATTRGRRSSGRTPASPPAPRSRRLPAAHPCSSANSPTATASRATGQADAGVAPLVRAYPDRFLLGSDTWINERWQGYGEMMGPTARGSDNCRSDRRSNCARQWRTAVSEAIAAPLRRTAHATELARRTRLSSGFTRGTNELTAGRGRGAQPRP